MKKQSKEKTLAQFFDTPEAKELFGMKNHQEYRGYDIYTQDTTGGLQTIATKSIKGGIQCYSVMGASELHYQAMRNKIDEVTQ